MTPAIRRSHREMKKPGSPSRLLRLPRELRDQILRYLLLERTQPPPNPSFPGSRIWRDDVAHPAHYSSWRYPSLVWVNQQLRNEYFDIVEEYAQSNQNKAELDIMSKGYVFYPTWIFLPPDLPGEFPYDLTVHLRIFSTEAYRSNDGWPRQPGSGFRCLLRLLNQLVHHGPSFGHHLELQRGLWLFVINRLTVNISFHDDYTPDTWPETSHNIFRMLKALATDGLAKELVKTIHAHTEYFHQGSHVVYDREWKVNEQYDHGKAEEWRATGFLLSHQRSLSDDYRPKYEDDYI